MTFRKHVVSLIVHMAAGSLLFAGCGGKDSPTGPTVTPPPPPPSPSVASIVVNPSTASLEVGGTQRFSASARASDGSTISGVNITWTSSKTAVVTINASGLATAVSAGTAMIRATADGVSSTPVMITVSEPPPPPPTVASVMVSPSEASIEEGQEQQFEAMAVTDDGMAIADVEFTWTSSDDNVATVSSMGLATGVSAGEVIITATVGDVSGSAMLTVTEPPPPPPPIVATVVVTPMEASIEEDGTQQFEAMASTSDGMVISGAEFAWTSSDDGVATVDQSGLSTGISAGEVMITAMAGDVSGSAMLTVTEPPPPPPPVVATVVVTPMEASIEEDGTQQFEAMASTSDGMVISGAEFAWTSSDDGVATVDQSGLSTGISAGEVMITAMAGDVSGSAMLTVTEPPPPPPPIVATVVVTPMEASIEEDGTQQFEAMASTSDGMVISGAEFAWTSSDDGVATVDQSGLSTGISAGEVMITAMAGDVSGSAMLTVTEPPPPPPPVVATVMVTPKEASIEEDGTQQFEAMASTSDGMVISGVEFAWTSSDDGVATVDPSGLVTGVRAGDATIRATVDGVSGTAMLTVTEPPPPPPPVVATVMVTPKEASIEEDGTQQFEAMASTSDGMVISGAEFAWTSSDDGVATVDQSGLSTGISAGEVTITASADDVTGTAMLTVTEPPPPPPPVVATVTVSPSEASIEEGQTQQFEAIAATAEGMAIADVEFTWTSSDDIVATVNSMGLATGVSAGEVMITATVDDVSGTATLTVTEPPPVVATVTVSPSEASIEEGQTQQFEAIAATAEGMAIADVEFTWTSSDDIVATVNSMGLATGVSAGEVMITATVDDVSGTATLTVTEPPPVVATVTVSPSEASIEEGQTQQFEAIAATAEGMAIAVVEFTWTSSDDIVATVNSMGLATGVSAGEVMITATVDDVSGTATLTVTEPPPVVARIVLSPSKATIEKGNTQLFTAMAFTSDNKEIPGISFIWTSNNTSVATVGPSGLATAIEAGTAIVEAKAEGISDTATLTVTAPPLPSRSGTFSGVRGYAASGSVTLEQNSSGSLILRFGSDFIMNASGFYVILYSSNNIRLRFNPAAPAGTFEELGRLKSRTGSQTYSVPSDVELDTYDFVIIYCSFIDREVGFAELQL